MFYVFYKTTNLINGKFYYGVHKTKNLNDNYLGSGNAIKFAIRKYGKDSFKKEIIKTFLDEESMYAFEKQYIDTNVVLDPKTYNQTLGGRGGFSHIDNTGNNNVMRNQDVVQKVVNSRKQNGSYKTKERLTHLHKISEKAKFVNKGKLRPAHSEFMAEYAKNIIWKDKEKMRNALSSTFVVTSPDGISTKTNRLQNFCVVNNLPYTSIWNNSKMDNPIKKGKAKDWRCIKE